MPLPFGERTSAGPAAALIRRLIAGLVALCALVFCGVFLWLWEINYNSDYALVGLFARRILHNAESPIFLFNVNYMGMLLEGWAVALSFKLFGAGPVTLDIPNTVFFLALIAATFYAVRETAAPLAGALAALFLAMGSPVFGMYVLRTQPNYTETFLFGTLLIWMYSRLLKQPKNAIPLTFLFGAIAGFGFYTYAQILYFGLGIGLHFFLLLLREQRRLTGLSLSGVLLPVRVGSGKILPAVLGLLHTVNSLHLALAMICFFRAEGQRPSFPLGIGQNPMASLMLSLKLWIVIQVIAIGMTQSNAIRGKLHLFAAGAAGLALGIAPKIYGCLTLHVPFSARTGMDGDWAAVANRLRIAAHAFVRFFNLDTLPVSLVWIPGVLTIGIVGVFLWKSAKAAPGLTDPGSERGVLDVSPYATLFAAVLFGFLVSNNATDFTRIRYLAPLVLTGAAAFGTVLATLAKDRLRPFAMIAGILLLANNAFALYRTAHEAPRPYPQLQILDWLRSKDLHAGVADYWYAYSITFLAGEEIVLDPLKDGYIPYYEPLVAQAPRIAYVDLTPPPATGSSFTLRGKTYRILETREFEGPRPFPYDPGSRQKVYASVLQAL